MFLLSFKEILHALRCNHLPQIHVSRQTCLNILAAEPANNLCLQLLGRIECQLGHADAAVAWYEKALAITPDSGELCFILSQAREAQKTYDKALHSFQQHQLLPEDQAKVYHLIGYRFKKRSNVANAMGAYNMALSLKSNFPSALNNLAVIIMENGMLDEATLHFQRVLEMKPDHANAWNNLGMICRQKGQWEQSMTYYEKALSFQPNFPEVFNNIGTSLQEMGRREEALESYNQALALKNNYPDCHNNRAMTLLSLGRFAEGWREYEWRWQSSHFCSPRQKVSAPLWQGEAAQGKTLLLQAEQGFGDTLQFCRYAPMAAARGLQIILEVQSALVRLLASLSGVDRIIAQGKELPTVDYYCPLLSLPRIFGSRPETLPAEVPYLFPPASTEPKSIPLTQSATRDFKVGLVWSGNSHRNAPDLAAIDQRRSIAPELLAPLINIDGIQFHSLQKVGPPAPDFFNLVDQMAACLDFADTAALIADLDLILSVDTAVAHLAGAMGKPIWLLNRFDSCWRWPPEWNNSPWYPTMRIFRQSIPGDWKSVILRVKSELEKQKSQ